MGTELDTRMALRESRIQLKQDIWRALSCTSKKQKLALVAEWKGKYCADHVKTLINCAKNKRAACEILEWKDEEL
jgi:hypothetical protein